MGPDPLGSRVITTRIGSYKPSGSCIRPYIGLITACTTSMSTLFFFLGGETPNMFDFLF